MRHPGMNPFILLFCALVFAAGCNGGGSGEEDADASENPPDLVGDEISDTAPDEDRDPASDPAQDPATDPTADDVEEVEYPPCDEETWAFTTVSDSYSGLEGNLASALRGAFENNADLKFVVSTGDFENLDVIEENMTGDLLGYFPGRDVVPWFMAIGNHNVEDPTDMAFVTETLGPRLATQLEGLTNFRQGPYDDANYWTGMHTTYSFDYRNGHFVIMNQYLGSMDDAEGHPLACPWDALLTWLEEDLDATTQPFIFVFGHEPAWPREDSPNHCGDSLDDGRCPGNTAPSPDEWKFIRPQRDRFWQILADHGVTAHFDGHTHASAARAVHGITDFNMASCIDTEWNCYCDIEGEFPETADGARLTPSDGVVDFNNGMTMASGPVNIVRIGCDEAFFGIYERNPDDGTLAPVRTFTFSAAP